jgi:hypothetical protein
MGRVTSGMRARKLQISVVILAMLGVLYLWPLNQIRAAAAKRILTPYEFLDKREAWLTSDIVRYRADATLDLYAMNLRTSNAMLNQHALVTLLSGTQRREGNDASVTPDFSFIRTKKRDPIKKQGEMTTRRAAEIFNQYPHGNGAASLHIPSPVVDQANADHRTSRTHSLLELGALKLLSFGRNRDGVHRSISAALHENERYDKNYSAKDAEPYSDQRIKRGVFGPFSCVPLSAQIAVAIFLTLAAWPLYRPFKVCIDKSLAVKGSASWVFVILAVVGFGCWLGSVTYIWASATYGIR